MSDLNRGRILHVQRLSTEDGPGIRTTVFFKGCPLRCEWCHNPESLASCPQIQWLEHRCIGCHSCLGVCPHGCLTATEQGIAIDRNGCQGCGLCSEACPANALELLGTAVTVEELAREVRKDLAYFTSGGGVTVSGGEPLMQPDFVAEFLAQMKQDGISTALDTCGLVSFASLRKVIPYTDLLLFDLKEIDSAKHQAFTGQPNDAIIHTLFQVSNYIRVIDSRLRLWLRTPLIPGATATRDNLLGLGAFIAEHLNGLVERWELCAFNNLCRDKYRRLGLEWRYHDTPLLTAIDLNRFSAYAKESGVDPAIVIATGATRKE
jgi:pyruvate formate lyase activating enzyme